METNLVPMKSPTATAATEAANAGLAGIIAAALIQAGAAKIPVLADPTISSALFVLFTTAFAAISKWLRKRAENKALAVQPLDPSNPASVAAHAAIVAANQATVAKLAADPEIAAVVKDVQ